MKKLILISLAVLLAGGGIISRPGLVVAQTTGLRAELVATNSPLSLKSGTVGQFAIALKNTGTTTWTNGGPNAVNLGTIKPMDHSSRFAYGPWIGNNRPATMQEASVGPNETAHFGFPAVAAGNGRMTDYFQLVMEGVSWFGPVITLAIDTQPAVFKGELVQQSATILDMKAADTTEVVVRVKNTGDAAWLNTGAGAVKIGTVNPNDRVSNVYDPSWWSRNRVGSLAGTVEPGAEGEFRFLVKAPSRVGTYKEDFGVVAEGMAWLPIRFSLTVKVSPAIWNAQWVTQSPPVSVAPGDTATIWVEFKNTGNTTWKGTGVNAVKLGTARVLDRASSFQSDTWLSKNRATAVTPAEVKPGEMGRFEFTVQAPNRIGVYKEYFRMVAEGITWFPDVGLYWQFSVDEELVIKDPIRVGLTSTTDTITVQGDNFVIRRGSDKSLVKKVGGGSVTATAFNGGYNLNTGEQVNDWLRFIPQNGSLLTVTTTGVGSTYNTFRGIIEVRRSSLSGNVWVVNILELEDYMKGIAEVPEGWPAEAQKAQMVAARTYAVRKLGAPVADIFDLYDDTRDQVYYGYDYESSRPGLSAAAEGTRGIIITYNGQPISAYYFSDSGGYTANVEDVWSQNLAYLRAVADPYAKPIDWSATLTQDYLQTRFDSALGITAGTDIITNMQVTERFGSNRVKTVLFTLQSGKTVPVSSKSFDYLTNNNDIKSMIFDVQATGDPARPDFIFTGHGWGHGVGLAQWGAKNMALQGKSYTDILTYYYTGVAITHR